MNCSFDELFLWFTRKLLKVFLLQSLLFSCCFCRHRKYSECWHSSNKIFEFLTTCILCVSVCDTDVFLYIKKFVMRRIKWNYVLFFDKKFFCPKSISLEHIQKLVRFNQQVMHEFKKLIVIYMNECHANHNISLQMKLDKNERIKDKENQR